ncbi:MAG: hypothetical protein JRH16_20500 [Deltaproteobacteria bacterium]|nr:hypothetical protein [Deltaproteobacteria bacterium]
MIPAGRHEIVQRYRPVALVRGALAGAALLTAALCGALLAQHRGRLRW